MVWYRAIPKSWESLLVANLHTHIAFLVDTMRDLWLLYALQCPKEISVVLRFSGLMSYMDTETQS